MLNQRICQEIDDLVIEESKGPMHLDFYIGFNQEFIELLVDANKKLGEDLICFSDIKLKNCSNNQLRRKTEEVIESIEKEIKENESEISSCKEKIVNFKKCKVAYEEDFKKGLYYNRYTGEIINETPETGIPEDAYNPGTPTAGIGKKGE